MGSDVKDAMIFVLTYFSSSQRKATKYVAFITGLDVIRIIYEPTAAAIAYGFDTEVYLSKEEMAILLFDLGGSTFDVSVLTVQNTQFEVKVVGGDMHLGVKYFDNRILNYCVQQF